MNNFISAHPPESLSLYIHVPFCTRKCRYCDFYSEPYSPESADTFIDMLAREWVRATHAYCFDNPLIETLYFGGGTPSILSERQWERLYERFVGRLRIADWCEWTVECNPDSWSSRKAQLWSAMGVSRLSVGVQSLDDRELRLLGRLHDSRRALDVLSSPQLERFSSVGVDLIFGIPGQRTDTLATTLTRLLENPVIRHLSAYELTVHDQTPFGRHARLLPMPSEDAVVDMLCGIVGQCKARGFERYEISNWAFPGHRCRHNVAYWTHKPYLGLGPGAHSWLSRRRFSNHSSLDRYLEMLGRGELPCKSMRLLSNEELSGELIMLGLRTADGIDPMRFEQVCSETFLSPVRVSRIEEMKARGLMVSKPSGYALTEQGMLVADAVTAFLVK